MKTAFSTAKQGHSITENALMASVPFSFQDLRLLLNVDGQGLGGGSSIDRDAQWNGIGSLRGIVAVAATGGCQHRRAAENEEHGQRDAPEPTPAAESNPAQQPQSRHRK